MWIEFMRRSDYYVVADVVNLGGNLLVCGMGLYGVSKAANAGLEAIGVGAEERAAASIASGSITRVVVLGGVAALGAAGVIFAGFIYAIGNRK